VPILRNPRHEKFAQELATGKSADAAYVRAGYRANRSNAARLSANQDIQKRVAEIQSLGAERARALMRLMYGLDIEQTAVMLLA
jgi:phage terminase small subunit